MNSIAQQYFDVLKQTYALRHQMLDTLSDDDLNYALPGNPALGDVLRTAGATDKTYIGGFSTGTQTWGTPPDEGCESVKDIKAWYTSLEEEMMEVLGGLSEEEIQGRMIDRGHGMVFPVLVNFHVYREALLIDAAKVSLYLRALNKPLAQQVQYWIG